MKKLLLILGLCCSISPLFAQEQRTGAHYLEDSHHNLIGYMTGPKLVDKDGKTLIEYKTSSGNMTVYDRNNKKVGYVINEGEVKDMNDKTIGYMVPNRIDYSTIIQDAKHSIIGYILLNGTVQDNMRNTIGYNVQSEHMWAAPYFFFFKS